MEEDAESFGGLFGAILGRKTRLRQNFSLKGGIDGQSSESSEVSRLRSQVDSTRWRRLWVELDRFGVDVLRLGSILNGGTERARLASLHRGTKTFISFSSSKKTKTKLLSRFDVL